MLFVLSYNVPLLSPYTEVVNCLLKRYAHDEATAKAAEFILRLTQPAYKTHCNMVKLS